MIWPTSAPDAGKVFVMVGALLSTTNRREMTVSVPFRFLPARSAVVRRPAGGERGKVQGRGVFALPRFRQLEVQRGLSERHRYVPQGVELFIKNINIHQRRPPIGLVSHGRVYYDSRPSVEQEVDLGLGLGATDGGRDDKQSVSVTGQRTDVQRGA